MDRSFFPTSFSDLPNHPLFVALAAVVFTGLIIALVLLLKRHHSVQNDPPPFHPDIEAKERQLPYRVYNVYIPAACGHLDGNQTEPVHIMVYGTTGARTNIVPQVTVNDANSIHPLPIDLSAADYIDYRGNCAVKMQLSLAHLGLDPGDLAGNTLVIHLLAPGDPRPVDPSVSSSGGPASGNSGDELAFYRDLKARGGHAAEHLQMIDLD